MIFGPIVQFGMAERLLRASPARCARRSRCGRGRPRRSASGAPRPRGAARRAPGRSRCARCRRGAARRRARAPRAAASAPGHHEHLLVGERDAPSGAERGQGRAQADGADEPRDDHVGRVARDGLERVRARARSRRLRRRPPRGVRRRRPRRPPRRARAGSAPPAPRASPTLRPAASASTRKRSGNWAATARVCSPIEPVLPSTTRSVIARPRPPARGRRRPAGRWCARSAAPAPGRPCSARTSSALPKSGQRSSHEVELGVGALPEQEVRDALLAAGADQEVHVGQLRLVQVGGEALLVEGVGVEVLEIVLAEQPPRGVDDLPAPSVGEREDELHAGAVLGALHGLVEGAAHRGRQPVAAAERADAHASWRSPRRAPTRSTPRAGASARRPRPSGGSSSRSRTRRASARRSPISRAARVTARTASTPARWPSLRARPRRSAHRPLPSMMTATWRGSAPWRSPGASMLRPGGSLVPSGSTSRRSS